MLNFQYYMPTRVIFGPDTLDQLGDTPHLPRGSKAMIVIGESGVMLKLGYLSRVQSLLSKQDVQTIVYDKIRPNPESDYIDKAAAICRDNDVDFVIGLGGGSTIDSAKAIAVLATNTGKYWDYMQSGSGGGQTPERAALPIVAIPTTAGTGTEADPWTVITKSGSNEKIGWGNDDTFPHLSIVDPKLMLSVPSKQTAYTGMDAFFHAVEATSPPAASPQATCSPLKRFTSSRTPSPRRLPMVTILKRARSWHGLLPQQACVNLTLPAFHITLWNTRCQLSIRTCRMVPDW